MQQKILSILNEINKKNVSNNFYSLVKIENDKIYIKNSKKLSEMGQRLACALLEGIISTNLNLKFKVTIIE